MTNVILFREKDLIQETNTLRFHITLTNEMRNSPKTMDIIRIQK